MGAGCLCVCLWAQTRIGATAEALRVQNEIVYCQSTKSRTAHFEGSFLRGCCRRKDEKTKAVTPLQPEL